MSSTNKNMLLHVILLLMISALMGGVFPLVKIIEQTITPLTLAMSRALLASLVLLFAVGVVMKRDLTPLIVQWKTYATLGILLGIFFVSIAESEVYITASLASLFTCIIPITTFLIATLALRWEQFTFARLGGSAIALGGVAMFIGLEKIQFDQSQITGVAIMASGMIIYAIYLIYSRASKLDPLLAATGTMVYVSMILAVAAFILEQPLQLHPSKEALLSTLVIGILSTGLAYMLLQYLITNAGAVFAATSGYFIPVFAILASYFLVGETINELQLVGLGLALVGAWLVNRKPSSPKIE
jgi:drug/metabolite transporter (DMT)-like permease